jgi:hypothetical protein
MLTERDGIQIKMHCITLEDLVPEEHFLRKLESAVDFNFIYDEVRNCTVRITADLVLTP